MKVKYSREPSVTSRTIVFIFFKRTSLNQLGFSKCEKLWETFSHSQSVKNLKFFTVMRTVGGRRVVLKGSSPVDVPLRELPEPFGLKGPYVKKKALQGTFSSLSSLKNHFFFDEQVKEMKRQKRTIIWTVLWGFRNSCPKHFEKRSLENTQEPSQVPQRDEPSNFKEMVL